MHRQHVNKHRAGKAFKRRVGLTHKVNTKTNLRGGIRL